MEIIKASNGVTFDIQKPCTSELYEGEVLLLTGEHTISNQSKPVTLLQYIRSNGEMGLINCNYIQQ